MKRNNSGGNGGNGGNRYPSYQKSGATPPGAAAGTVPMGYQPPVHYAADQTKALEDTTRAFYQADETAGHVLEKMTAQRQQLNAGHADVFALRQATEQARRELQELHKKYQQKKQKLYAVIALLALTDMMLFLRIVQCRGSFFC